MGGKVMASPTEPMNPYQPSRVPLNDAPPESPPRRSFADRTSVGLGIAGAVAMVSSFVLGALGRGVLVRSRGTIEMASGLLVEAAFVAYAVGIGVVFAAPRGRRTRGLVVNGLALGFLVVLLFAAFAVRHHIKFK